MKVELNGSCFMCLLVKFYRTALPLVLVKRAHTFKCVLGHIMFEYYQYCDRCLTFLLEK